jgi:predicted esterase
MRVWVYRRVDRAPSGSVLVAPGLHFLGPEDVRFDRFCRVLARSGALVFAPFLPTYLALDVTPAVIAELEHALDALLSSPDRPARRPSLFSISFGSMPALRVASRRQSDLEQLVVFGGFHSFERTLRFALMGDRALSGEGARKHDPLNAPVVVQNLLPYFEPRPAPEDERLLRAAFRAYCGRTWGRPEMKVERAFEVHARAVAETLPPPLRPLFAMATRAGEGIEPLALGALERGLPSLRWIDPVPHLGTLPKTTLVHGRDDDVIPFEESEALAGALGARGLGPALHLTGMYGHTGKATLAELVARAGALPGELSALGHIVHVLARL